MLSWLGQGQNYLQKFKHDVLGKLKKYNTLIQMGSQQQYMHFFVSLPKFRRKQFINKIVNVV